MKKIESFVRAIIHRARTYRYHRDHKTSAKQILKAVESQKGKTNPKLIKLSHDYANDVFGWSGYAPWLCVYSAMAEIFKEGWIPDNYYGWIVAPSINGDYGETSTLKAVANKLFEKSIFPDIAYYVNGLWISNNGEVLNENDLKGILFEKSKTVVYKADNSLQGRGIIVLEKASFDTKDIKSLGNGVFQEYIFQHPFFEEMMPSSVATLRVTTVLENSGNASARACYLRIGRKTDTHVRSASHIRVPVNPKSGAFGAGGYTVSWLPIDRHPDSNIAFADKQIPVFDKCLATALELHTCFPFVQCIGWDMIIDRNDNVRVMEWNGGHNDIKFSEATQGPCFSDLGWEKLWRKNANAGK